MLNEMSIKAGPYLVIFHWTPEEIEKIREILDRTKVPEPKLHMQARVVRARSLSRYTRRPSQEVPIRP